MSQGTNVPQFVTCSPDPQAFGLHHFWAPMNKTVKDIPVQVFCGRMFSFILIKTWEWSCWTIQCSMYLNVYGSTRLVFKSDCAPHASSSDVREAWVLPRLKRSLPSWCGLQSLSKLRNCLFTGRALRPLPRSLPWPVYFINPISYTY